MDAKLEFDACYIYQDVNRAIQHVHRTGLVHRGILSDPHKYLVKNVSPVTSVSIFCCKMICLTHADDADCLVEDKITLA